MCTGSAASATDKACVFMQIAAILLAAGSSVRFGRDKLFVTYKGRELYAHALSALCASSCIDEVVVVVRPCFAIPRGWPRCRFVVNPDHAEGMGSSLRTGIGATAADTNAFLIALADMPEVTSGLVDALVAEFRNGEKKIIIPVCRGRRGHPVVVSGKLRSALLACGGDMGARQLVHDHLEMVGHFVTENEAVLFDVDMPDDMLATNSRA